MSLHNLADAYDLLIRLIIGVIGTSSSLIRCAFASHTAGPALTIGRCDGKVDVLLRVQTHHKLWDIHQLLAHAAMDDDHQREE